VPRFRDDYNVALETESGIQWHNAYEVRPRIVEDDWLIFEPAQDPHIWRYEISVRKPG